MVKWDDFETQNGFEGLLGMVVMTTNIQICFILLAYK
jgi:hypothetical protein